MKPILYIKGSSITDVRLQKFITFFENKNQPIYFWGWDRKKENKIQKRNVSYLLKRGGYNNKWLLLYYPIWMIIVFFKILFSRGPSNYNIIAINFECGLPVYLASKIRKYEYIYEIYDEFSLSHKFPIVLKKMLIKLDRSIMKNSEFVIHVDKNRLTFENCHNIIIENSPFDYYNEKPRNYESLTHTFAIIGNISKVRGISEIYEFAKVNPSINFILAGTFYDDFYKEKFLSCSNVSYFDRMPQDALFSKLETCCGIFSLYDASLEINRLAASNKVYDAMMLGIPVITNPEVINSDFIKSNEIGIIINYKYDTSWNILSDPNFLKEAIRIGKRGRKLYLETYKFNKLVEDRLIPQLK